MSPARTLPSISRRGLLCGFAAGGAILPLASGARGTDADMPADAILELTGGRMPQRSERFTLAMPESFANGFTVPMTVSVDSPMTTAEHVLRIDVLAPGNPILHVVSFRFTPRCGKAKVSTRIRLARPQHVHAVAALSDGTHLLASTWVEVATNGCPT